MKTIYLLLIIIIFSCRSTEKPSSNLLKTNTISFNTGMSVRSKNIGTYYSKTAKQEFIYFGNVETSKKIKIFSLDSKLRHSIQLDTVLKQCKKIDDFNIVSKDTIIILSQYSNMLYFINVKGEIWKKQNLNLQINTPNNDFYEFCSSYTVGQTILNDTTIILSSDWRNSFNDTIKRNNIEEVKYFYQNIWNTPKLLKIDNIYNDSLSYILAYNQYKVLFPKDSNYIFTQLPLYTLINDKIYSFCDYSNKITIIKPNDLTIENFIEIELKNKFKIGRNKIESNKENIIDLQNIINVDTKEKSSIRRICYSQKQNLFFIKVLSKITYENFMKTKYRPWVLNVYDSEFKKLDEITFNEKSQSGIFMNSSLGLMIQDKKEIKDYSNQKITFDIYEYKK